MNRSYFKNIVDVYGKENPALLVCTSLGGRGGCFGVGCFGQVGPVERAPHREPPNPQPGQYVMVMLACPTFVIHLCDNWDRCFHVHPQCVSYQGRRLVNTVQDKRRATSPSQNKIITTGVTSVHPLQLQPQHSVVVGGVTV